jgi:hypothetical protein
MISKLDNIFMNFFNVFMFHHIAAHLVLVLSCLFLELTVPTGHRDPLTTRGLAASALDVVVLSHRDRLLIVLTLIGRLRLLIEFLLLWLVLGVDAAWWKALLLYISVLGRLLAHFLVHGVSLLLSMRVIHELFL